MSFAVSQNLLRNRTRFMNRIPVMQAQSTLGARNSVCALSC